MNTDRPIVFRSFFLQNHQTAEDFYSLKTDKLLIYNDFYV